MTWHSLLYSWPYTIAVDRDLTRLLIEQSNNNCALLHGTCNVILVLVVLGCLFAFFFVRLLVVMVTSVAAAAIGPTIYPITAREGGVKQRQINHRPKPCLFFMRFCGFIYADFSSSRIFALSVVFWIEFFVFVFYTNSSTTISNCFICLCIYCCCSFFFFCFVNFVLHLNNCRLIQRDTRPTPIIKCRMSSGKHARGVSPAPDHRTEARLRIDPKVLVFVETTYSGLGRDIAELLVYNRIKWVLIWIIIFSSIDTKGCIYSNLI